MSRKSVKINFSYQNWKISFEHTQIYQLHEEENVLGKKGFWIYHNLYTGKIGLTESHSGTSLLFYAKTTPIKKSLKALHSQSD